jgi:hypothetical protein
MLSAKLRKSNRNCAAVHCSNTYSNRLDSSFLSFLPWAGAVLKQRNRRLVRLTFVDVLSTQGN